VPALAAWDQVDPVLAGIDDRQALDFTVQMVQGDLAYMKGLAQLRAGHAEAAIATWGQLRADLAPLKQLHNNIGSSLAEAGHADAALAFYERALAEDDDYLLAWRNRAAVHTDLGQHRQAALCLERAVALDPADKALRWNLARLLAEDETRVADALAQYEALAQADWEDPKPWREAGRLLQRVGDLSKAADAFRASLRRDRDQRDVSEQLDRIERGLAAWGEDAGQVFAAAAAQHEHASGDTVLRPPAPPVPQGLPAPVIPEPTPLVPSEAALAPGQPVPASSGFGVVDERRPGALGDQR
jgi:tetratricopeptide (TPR) repeat protein